MRIKELKERINKNEQFEYIFFYGESPWNQWSPCEFVIDDIQYSSSEQYMMAEKARLFNDPEMLLKIMSTDDCNKIKMEYGRNVRGYSDEVWFKHREKIVYDANYAKFTQNINFKQQLLNSGTQVLVEASPVDPIWGIGMWQDDERCLNPNEWGGLNLLGFVIMDVRETILKEELSENFLHNNSFNGGTVPQFK